jgi:small basic protein
VGALGCGAGYAGALISLTQIVVRRLQVSLSAAAYQEAVGDPLLAGLLAGVVLGAFFGLRRSAALDNMYQRGVIAVLSAVGGLLIGFLAAVMDRFFGLAGLVLWMLASLALGFAGSRWARKASAA